MTTLATPTANMSLKLPITDKEALQQIAKKKNRSTHFVMLEMIQKGLQEAREEAEYQEYIKTSVLLTEKRIDEQGSDGLTREQVKSSVMENVREFLKNNK